MTIPSSDVVAREIVLLSMRFAPVDAILTSLNPVDNVKAGVSYFLAEVTTMTTSMMLAVDRVIAESLLG